MNHWADAEKVNVSNWLLESEETAYFWKLGATGTRRSGKALILLSRSHVVLNGDEI